MIQIINYSNVVLKIYFKKSEILVMTLLFARYLSLKMHAKVSSNVAKNKM